MTDVSNAIIRIGHLLQTHSSTIGRISQTVSSVFEALCLTYFAECYEKKLGYQVRVIRPINGYFRFKFSTRGNPNNYSAFKISKDGIQYEIIHNIYIESANDPNVKYVVDIAVVKPEKIIQETIERNNRKYSIQYCKNSDVITFAECKHIVAYNMLIAQFLGVIFEIKPEHLHKSKFSKLSKLPHILPSLLVSGRGHIGAERAIKSMRTRKYAIIIATNLFVSPIELFDQILLRK